MDSKEKLRWHYRQMDGVSRSDEYTSVVFKQRLKDVRKIIESLSFSQKEKAIGLLNEAQAEENWAEIRRLAMGAIEVAVKSIP